jgi:hypothetical protein
MARLSRSRQKTAGYSEVAAPTQRPLWRLSQAASAAARMAGKIVHLAA